jgi:hypothetical protein
MTAIAQPFALNLEASYISSDYISAAKPSATISEVTVRA